MRGLGHDALMQARDQFLQLASQDPTLSLVRPNGKSDEPQYQVVIDDEKARALQVSIEDINDTMSVAVGLGLCERFHRPRPGQAGLCAGQHGLAPGAGGFRQWYVRNAVGEMVPFSAFATGEWIYGSPKLERYNGVPAVEILGQPAPGS